MQDDDARRLLIAEQERLRGLREQGVAALEQMREGGPAEPTTYDRDEADAATELHDLEVNETLVESLDAELAELGAALQRLEEGTYGRCQHCGRPLPDERLEAIPTARYCVDHQPATAPEPEQL